MGSPLRVPFLLHECAWACCSLQLKHHWRSHEEIIKKYNNPSVNSVLRRVITVTKYCCRWGKGETQRIYVIQMCEFQQDVLTYHSNKVVEISPPLSKSC